MRRYHDRPGLYRQPLDIPKYQGISQNRHRSAATVGPPEDRTGIGAFQNEYRALRNAIGGIQDALSILLVYQGTSGGVPIRGKLVSMESSVEIEDLLYRYLTEIEERFDGCNTSASAGVLTD